jgi:hypothetical protein
MKIEKLIILFICIIIFSCKKEDDKLVFEIGDDFQFSHEHSIYFKDLVWKDSLTSKDLNTINNAFFSPHCNIKGEGRFINNEELILVHRINFPQKRDTSFYWERFNKYINKSLELTDREYDEYLFSQIDEKDFSKKKVFVSHAAPSNSQIFLNALTIRQIKRLRNGNSPNIVIPDSLVKGYNNQIRFSKYPEEEAIDKLISIVLDTTKNTRLIQNQSLDILKTYLNPRPAKQFVEMIKDTLKMKEIDEYGKAQIFRYLEYTAHKDLTQKEGTELVEFLNKRELFENIYHYNRYSIGYLTHLFSDESIEEINKRINADTLINKEAKRKMMERIQKEIDERKNKN